MEDLIQIEVEQKSGEKITLEASQNCTVGSLKYRLFEKTRVEQNKQRLFYEGIEMDDRTYRLEYYDIQPRKNTIYRIRMEERFAGIPQTYFLNENYFDHKWTCSFENISKDDKTHMRGGYEYTRPLGCVRYGIKVLNKYPDGDGWIGTKGTPTSNEWPVAYHGTAEKNVLDILRDGLDINKCVRFAFGQGIYCSPDPKTAIQYGQNYTYHGPDGSTKDYKLILQCRVNPAKLKVVAKCVLPTVSAKSDYWIVPDGSGIRPYGICAYDYAVLLKMMPTLFK